MSPIEQFEPYVDATRASGFLDIDRKFLLKLARLGRIPAYPVGIGSRRKWKFKISDLDGWMQAQRSNQTIPEYSNFSQPKRHTNVPLAASATQRDNRPGNARVAREENT
jgi:hypothetical protein